jgi:ankyrin repeat protein
MFSKTTIVLLVLFISLKSIGQNENVFLDRAYWKTNPTINNINQKIMEGHDITALNSFAFDPICYALLEKVDNNIIKYLLTKKGNEVNKMTHDGRTYIFWAAYKNNLEMMKYLKDIGANMNIVDNHGYSLLNFAATTGQLNTELYDFCIENGSDPSKEKNHSGANALLLVTPHIKDISLINYFTSKGIDMKTTDSNGNGIFNYAAKAGNIPLMNYLLKQGISYKKLNKQGENAMILASRGIRNKSNSLKSFQYLESLGISPKIISKNGITPLHAISYRGKDIEIFEYFLSKGVDINQADDKGNTPFMNAAYMNEAIIVSFLSDHVRDVNHQNKKGMTALSNAIQRNSIEVIKFLLDIGADVHIKDKKGNTLSYYLIKSLRDKNLDTFKQKVAIVSQKGLDITQYQQDGNSLFHLAVETNNTELVQWVHSYNLNINTKNNNGLTPLQKAVMSAKNDKMIQLLVSLGADKTIKTDFGESTYDLALENELLKKNNINIEFLK